MDENISRYFEERLPKTFWIWAIAHLIFTFSSLYNALYPIPCPNPSLFFYALSILCILQMSPFFRYSFLTLRETNPHKKIVIIILVMLYCLFLICTSILSLAATFYLFPNPMLHKSLASCIYGAGFVMSFMACYHGYLMLHGKVSEEMNCYIQKKTSRIHRVEKWVMEVVENSDGTSNSFEDIEKENQDTVSFPVSFSKYLASRSFHLIIWALVMWMFVVIPLKSSPSILTLSTPLATIASIVIALFIIWMASFINYTGVSYCINERSFIYKSLWNRREIVWNRILFVSMNGDKIAFQIFQGKDFEISLNGLSDFKAFWEKLQEMLPLEIFFISEESWYYLRKALDEDFEEFLKKYQTVISSENTKKEPKRKDKRKESKRKK